MLIDLLEDIANKFFVISLNISLKISFVNTLILIVTIVGDGEVGRYKIEVYQLIEK